MLSILLHQPAWWVAARIEWALLTSREIRKYKVMPWTQLVDSEWGLLWTSVDRGWIPRSFCSCPDFYETYNLLCTAQPGRCNKCQTAAAFIMSGNMLVSNRGILNLHRKHLRTWGGFNTTLALLPPTKSMMYAQVGFHIFVQKFNFHVSFFEAATNRNTTCDTFWSKITNVSWFQPVHSGSRKGFYHTNQFSFLLVFSNFIYLFLNEFSLQEYGTREGLDELEFYNLIF